MSFILAVLGSALLIAQRDWVKNVAISVDIAPIIIPLIISILNIFIWYEYYKVRKLVHKTTKKLNGNDGYEF
jgi:hypothetical protein